MSLASRLQTHAATLQRASSSPDGMGGVEATLSCLGKQEDYR